MTPEQEMQAVVEATPGECWHSIVYPSQDAPHCINCGVIKSKAINPSPTDLKELFRLAKKQNYHSIQFYRALAEPCEFCDIDDDYGSITGQGGTPSDALRNALYQAVKGKGQ